MLFNTPQFLLFFLSVILFFYIIPVRLRKIYLLIISYLYAYFLGGMGTILFLFTATSITYVAAIIIEKSKRKGIYLTLFLIALFVLLYYEKYMSFSIDIFSTIFSINPIRVNIVVAVGISYYILSAISYLVDIYRGIDIADYNYIDVAIWLAFFTKIIAGPIERHKSFGESIKNVNVHRFDEDRFKRGLLIVSLGYFYKLVIADRIAIMVDRVYENLDEYRGIILLVVVLFYSLQIYFDFAGYSLIALGIAYMLGINIVNNFAHPYFANSVTSFWRKWHISLSSWLRDYIYIPLGGNRKGKNRHYINLLITFLVSGLWHGTGFRYIFWGLLHGIYQIIEKLIVRYSNSKIKIPVFVQQLITFLLITIAWVPFRAASMSDATKVFKNMSDGFNLAVIWDGSLLDVGLDIYDYVVLACALLIAFIKNRNISLYNIFRKMNIAVRWACYSVIFLVLLIFGVYGAQFDANNFIYFKY